MITVLRGVIGLTIFVGIAYLLSSNRRAISWRLVASGLGLQIVLALLVLETTPGQLIFEFLGSIFAQLLEFTYSGSEFIFGPLGNPDTSENPIFAFQVLPIIVFFASLMGILYFLKLIQPVVRGMGWLMSRTLRISGAEALASAANVFVGQTEAPLMVRPYIQDMTRSELMTLMTGGMATIAGSVMAAYITLLGGESAPERSLFATHLLTASIMSAPAAIVTAKMLVPETDTPETLGTISTETEKRASNLLEAATEGASQGLKLALNVGAMLLAFIALIDMINALLTWLGHPVVHGTSLYNLNQQIEHLSNGQFTGLTLQSAFAFLFAPLAWAMGIPTPDVLLVGTLLGEKIAVNEFVAFTSLNDIKQTLNQRSVLISTYALCGFANVGSIAVQIGGIGGIAPSRRSELAALGWRAVAAGALASWMTATVAGTLLGLS